MCKGTSKAQAEGASIPFLGRAWRSVLLSLPQIKFPFTNLNISLTLLTAAFLMTSRFLSGKVFESVFEWPVDAQVIGAGSFAAIVHSTMLVPGLVAAFMSHKYNPSEPLKASPKWWQQWVDALLQFCTGYMVYDGIFIVLSRIDPSVSLAPVFIPSDFMFLGHHLATAIYMTQTRVYKAGHMSAMMCMFLGEFTNPLHNAYSIFETAMSLDCCKEHALVQLFYDCIEVAWAFEYVLFRTVIGPIFCLHMSYDLMFSKHAKEYLPLPVRIFWNFMIWAVIFGSKAWVVFGYHKLEERFWGVGAEQEL